jgi:hypothetical protein
MPIGASISMIILESIPALSFQKWKVFPFTWISGILFISNK